MAAADPDVVRLAEAQLKFSTALYKEIREDEANLVFCPTSIWAILAMLGAGAKGDTMIQIAEALNLPTLDTSSEAHEAYRKVAESLQEASSSSVEMIIASSVFFDSLFAALDEFEEFVQKQYQASIQFVKFQTEKEQACEDVNSWAETQTKEKIKDLIAPEFIDEYTKLVLVNAVYMKGLWSKKFDPTVTTPDAFHLLDGTIRVVDMMYQKGKFRFGNNEQHNSLVLEMPYEGDQFAMYVVLPGSNEAFQNLEQSLTGDVIQDLLSSLKRMVSVFLWLPRFEAEAKLMLHQVLPKLGIENLFSEESADLSGMSEFNDLVVSAILHKSVIVVDEEGSEAAAATAAVVRQKRCAEHSEEFHANRPFIYFIRHNQTGTILFIGRLTSPPVSEAVGKDEL